MGDKIISIVITILIILGFFASLIYSINYKSNSPNYYDYTTMNEFSEKNE